MRFDLGDLEPNRTGVERVTVQTAAVIDGWPLVVDAASLTAQVSFLPQGVRATSVSRIGTDPLLLRAEVQPDPVAAGELIDVQLSVANPTSSATGSLALRVLWPDELDFQSPVTTAGGGCPGTCDAGEYVFWNLGTLGPGAALTVSLNEPLGSLTSGTLIPFEIELLEVGAAAHTVSQTLRAQNDSPLELTIDPLRDPVAPSSTLVYRLTYGNTGASTVVGTSLDFPLPVGSSFRAASGGGVLQNGVVTWNLGALPPRSGGRVEVTVDVAALATPAFLDINNASLSGTVKLLAAAHACRGGGPGGRRAAATGGRLRAAHRPNG